MAADSHPPKPLASLSEAEIMASWNAREPVLVSILCATYNHRDFIEAALNGFLGQVASFPFEIIVRDDASTDGTAEVLQEYAKRYPHIIRTVFEKENQYSQGIKHQSVTYPLAKGKFIALCDGDDYWLDPMKLQKQYDFLTGHPEYVICYQPALVVNMNKLASRNYFFSNRNSCDDSAIDLQKGLTIFNSSAFFRNHLAKLPVAFYKLNYGDLFLFAFLGQFGQGRQMNNLKPVVYRIHAGGIWSGVGSTNQRINLAMSYLSLSQYFLGQHNPQLAAHHVVKTMSCLTGLNPRLSWRMRLAVAFPTLSYCYLKLKRRQ
jgi:glycosyltransferase involved in cell wall biosynthesis